MLAGKKTTAAAARPAAGARPRSSRQKALLAAQTVAAKKAQDTVILDLRKLTVIADYFVICSGVSETHVRALAEELLRQLAAHGSQHIAAQGVSDGRWALVDLGDVIVHIFMQFEREFYDLEGLWGKAPTLAVA